MKRPIGLLCVVTTLVMTSAVGCRDKEAEEREAAVAVEQESAAALHKRCASECWNERLNKIDIDLRICTKGSTYSESCFRHRSALAFADYLLCVISCMGS